MGKQWAEVPAYAASLEAVRGPGSLDALLAEFEAAPPAMEDVARTIGHRFADLIIMSS